MTGIEFGRVLAGAYPGMRLIFMTGWPNQPDVEKRRPGALLLMKPFKIAELPSALGGS